MGRAELKPGRFKNYPPEGRRLAIEYVALLQELPVSFVSLLLREIIVYDWNFPVERAYVQQQLGYLASLAIEERQDVMSGFARLRLSAELERFDWVSSPAEFSNLLSAHLWATHQIDAMRAAALDYGRKVDAAKPPERLPIPRLGIVVIGRGVAATSYPLFRKLRNQGVFFQQIRPEGGLRILLDTFAARATAHPLPFGHWYIDGAASEPVSCPELTLVSFSSLAPQRAAVLKNMENIIQSGSGGPEVLHGSMLQLRPEQIGLNGTGGEAVLNHFQTEVLAQGSGTQVFSTSFVQWTAREALRRAQPVSLLVRFAPRQRERSLNDLIASPQQKPVLDHEGSLIDADMGAYLTWVNQQRLSGAGQASFLVWWEDHQLAVAIGPGLPRGTESSSPLDMREILNQVG
jgi:hypothetical protein